MSTQLTINLPEEVVDDLNKVVSEEGRTPSDVVSVALKDYLFIRKFRTLRERMTAKAETEYSDEDVFDQVS